MAVEAELKRWRPIRDNSKPLHPSADFTCFKGRWREIVTAELSALHTEA
jgi:hypothetical protein